MPRFRCSCPSPGWPSCGPSRWPCWCGSLRAAPIACCWRGARVSPSWFSLARVRRRFLPTLVCLRFLRRGDVRRRVLARLDAPVLQRLFPWRTLRDLVPAERLHANGSTPANGALNFDFLSSTPTEVATFTVAWAVIATGLLIAGFLLRWPAARGAAFALLLATIVKCFGNDVPRLEGVSLLASLLGLGLSLVVVGVTIQKFRTAKAA